MPVEKWDIRAGGAGRGTRSFLNIDKRVGAMKLRTISLMVGLTFATNCALADVPAITFSSLTYIDDLNLFWNLGFEFQANSNTAVSQLGSLAQGVGGSPVQIGLWDSSGNLLASASVNGSSPVQNLFSWAQITPVPISAGSAYRVASVGYTSYGWDPVGASSAPQITYIKDVFNVDWSTLSFPDQSAGRTELGASGWYGANVQLVPEPESYAMMLAGLGLLGFMARRRKQKAA